MTLRQLDIAPEELLVQLEEVPYLIRPKVEYLRIDETETPPVHMPVLVKQDGFQQIYLKNAIKIFQELRAAEKDNYHSLSERQPLVQENKLSIETMTKIFTIFGYGVLHVYATWVGLIDWTPDKRIRGYKLKNGANAVFYEDWKELPDYKIDVSDAIITPTNWVETSREVNKTMVKQFGLPENTHVWSNKRRAINRYDGLNAVQLSIRSDGVFALLNDWEPWHSGTIRGALLGKDMKAEDMVRNFDSSKIKIEAIEQRIATLKRWKP